MFPLSTLGAVHTLISLIALAAGLASIMRYRRIVAASSLGQLYIAGTVLSCVSGLFIFAHGGFGKPHALSIVTLVLLFVAWAAGYTRVFGRQRPILETIAYSTTVFLHFIPGVAESLTRLPVGAPLARTPEDPLVTAIVGVIFLFFLAGVWIQVRSLRAKAASGDPLRARTPA